MTEKADLDAEVSKIIDEDSIQAYMELYNTDREKALRFYRNLIDAIKKAAEEKSKQQQREQQP